MKTTEIIGIADLFYKKAGFIKKANLLGDMARRVMFSLIPAKKFDYFAARWAAMGVLNSVYYGTQAIMRELRYYDGPQLNLIHYTDLSELNKDYVETYKNILSKAIQAFDDLKNWQSQYGGKRWGKIAVAALGLVRTYEKLLTAKKYSDEEEALLKKIIIELNIFDGLAHNMGGIFDKMIALENYKQNGYEDREEVNTTTKKMYRIRNMTELKNQKHVFKEIYPLLYPRMVYQDYITEIVNDPEFRTKENFEEELFLISRRKTKKQIFAEYVEFFAEIKNKNYEELNVPTDVAFSEMDAIFEGKVTVSYCYDLNNIRVRVAGCIGRSQGIADIFMYYSSDVRRGIQRLYEINVSGDQIKYVNDYFKSIATNIISYYHEIDKELKNLKSLILKIESDIDSEIIYNPSFTYTTKKEKEKYQHDIIYTYKNQISISKKIIIDKFTNLTTEYSNIIGFTQKIHDLI